MIRDDDLIHEIMLYLEEYRNTRFLRYSADEVSYHLELLLDDGLVKPVPFTMELNNRTELEKLVLRYMLTAKGHRLLEQERLRNSLGGSGETTDGS